MALALFSGAILRGAVVAPQKLFPSAAVLPRLCVDVNRGPEGELASLPGIGPSTAEGIIERRRERGPFHRIDDLLGVKGIGPAKLAIIASRICPPEAGVSGSGE